MERGVLSQQSLWSKQWKHWPVWRHKPGQPWNYYKERGKVRWFITENAALNYIERKSRAVSTLREASNG